MQAGLLRCQVRYLLHGDYTTDVVSTDIQKFLRVLLGLLLQRYYVGSLCTSVEPLRQLVLAPTLLILLHVHQLCIFDAIHHNIVVIYPRAHVGFARLLEFHRGVAIPHDIQLGEC